MRRLDDLATWGDVQAVINRVEKLETAANKAEKRINTLMADRTRIKERMRRMEELLNGVDMDKATSTIAAYVESLEATTELSNLLITKLTITQMVAYLLELEPKRRAYAINGCVLSWDAEDKFWNMLDHLPVNRYAALFARCGRENRGSNVKELKEELDREIGLVDKR